MKPLAAFAVVILTGCAAPVPEVVKVPVSVPCIAEAPQMPALASGEALRGMSDEVLVLTIAAEWRELAAYALTADALMRRCR